MVVCLQRRQTSYLTVSSPCALVRGGKDAWIADRHLLLILFHEVIQKRQKRSQWDPQKVVLGFPLFVLFIDGSKRGTVEEVKEFIDGGKSEIFGA